MATLTITTTGAQDTRIIAAFRAHSGNQAATGAEVKAWLIDQLKAMVHSYETRVANEAASAAVTPTSPT